MAGKIIRSNYADLCRVLGSSPPVLNSVTNGFFACNMIDLQTKVAIQQSTSFRGASTLMDHIQMKVEQSESYMAHVLEIFGQETLLEGIVHKMEPRYVSKEKKQQQAQTFPTENILSSEDSMRHRVFKSSPTKELRTGDTSEGEKLKLAKKVLKENQVDLKNVVVAGGLVDIVHACEAKGLITEEKKRQLVDLTRGRSEDERAFELLDTIRRSLVSTPSITMDKFLCIISNNGGDAGNRISRQMANEYGFPLINFDTSAQNSTADVSDHSALPSTQAAMLAEPPHPAVPLDPVVPLDSTTPPVETNPKKDITHPHKPVSLWWIIIGVLVVALAVFFGIGIQKTWEIMFFTG